MTQALNDRRANRSRRSQGRRRRVPRVRGAFEGFYESRHRCLIGRASNLNFRGTFLPTPVPDEPGTEALVRLALPGSPVLLKLPARVVWSNANPNRGPTGMGLRFEALALWQIKRIAAVMLRAAGWQTLPQLAPQA